MGAEELFKFREVDGVTIVACGEIDEDRAPKFQETIAWLSTRGKMLIVLDISKVTDVVTGVSYILAASTGIDVAGGKLVLLSPVKEIAEFLTMLDVGFEGDIYYDEAEALESFTQAVSAD